MSNSLLASYFTNSADISSNSSDVDICGRSFFDIISECKDFSKIISPKNPRKYPWT